MNLSFQFKTSTCSSCEKDLQVLADLRLSVGVMVCVTINVMFRSRKDMPHLYPSKVPDQVWAPQFYKDKGIWDVSGEERETQKPFHGRCDGEKEGSVLWRRDRKQ